MPNVAELIRDHVTLDLRCVDRLYLNAYVPRLQQSGGVVGLLLQRGHKIPSPTLFGHLTRAFRSKLESWQERAQVPLLRFERGQRKDDLVERYRRRFQGEHGVVVVGVAQERSHSWRGTTTSTAPLHFAYSRTTVCVNHYYFYVIDREWGPAFIKVSSYLPYTIKLCLNGHEWAKRQLAKRGVSFTALDNGFLDCADPAALQEVCDSLSQQDIEDFFARWLACLPLPLDSPDYDAGFTYRLSMLQVEVSRTQVFDQPRRGREFFEEVIRDNLDLGRPERVGLLFERRIRRTTPSHFSTRVITQGVFPSIHVEYKRCHIKQYFKEGRALRTETTFNDTTDFGVKKGLSNFAYLRTLGQHINSRLLAIERVAHDCALSQAQLSDLTQPSRTAQGQPAPALKFGQPRVMALLEALNHFGLTPEGLTNRRLRPLVAHLLGLDDTQYTARQMGYDLRRLARKGLIRQLPHKLCYVVTPYGRQVSLFLTKVHNRVLRPGLQALDLTLQPASPAPLRTAFNAFERALTTYIHHANLVA